LTPGFFAAWLNSVSLTRRSGHMTAEGMGVSGRGYITRWKSAVQTSCNANPQNSLRARAVAAKRAEGCPENPQSSRFCEPAGQCFSHICKTSSWRWRSNQVRAKEMRPIFVAIAHIQMPQPIASTIAEYFPRS
jgi:hypothetical protein